MLSLNFLGLDFFTPDSLYIRFYYRARRLVYHAQQSVKAAYITLSSVLLGGMVALLPQVRFEFGDYVTLAIGIAAILGTIIALTFTLSLIPIQRASEAFTPAIIRLYKQDRATKLVFFILCAACILPVLALAFFEPLHSHWNLHLSAQLVILGIGLDAVRYYHAHAIDRLDPEQVLSYVAKMVARLVHKQKRAVSKVAKKIPPSADVKDKEEERRITQAVLYKQNSHLDDAVLYWLDTIFEIANKSLGLKEQTTFRRAIVVLLQISNSFLTGRADSTLFMPDREMPLWVTTSTVDPVLNRVLEHLSSLNKEAIKQGNEGACTTIMQGYGSLAVLLLQLKIHTSIADQNPLAGRPLYYLGSSATEARAAGFRDAGLEAVRQAQRVVMAAPETARQEDVALPAIQTIQKVIAADYGKGEDLIAQSGFKSLLAIVGRVLDIRHWELRYITKRAFEILEACVPAQLLLEKGKNPLTGTVSPAYSMLFDHSIGALCGQSVSLLKPRKRDNKKTDYEFREFNDILEDHLRDVCRKHDLSNSFVQHDLVQTVRHICKVYHYVLKTVTSDEQIDSDIEKLVDQLRGYTGCLAWQKKYNPQHAWEAGRVYAVVALHYIHDDPAPPYGLTIVSHFVKQLVMIATAAYRCNYNYKATDYLRVVENIWYIERYLRHRNETALADTVHALYWTKPQEVSDADWEEIRQALSRSSVENEEELNTIDSRFDLGNRPDVLLRRLLRQETVETEEMA